VKQKLFCNFCGGRLDNAVIEDKQRRVCGACNHVYYENPLPVVSIVVQNARGDVLLVRRAQEPSKGMWCFPIGFAECGETIQEAAVRELKEESGIDGEIVRLLDVMSDRTDTYGEVVVVTFVAEKTGGTEVAGDDACDVAYFPITQLPELAFTSQKQALEKLTAERRAAEKGSFP
jgi:8-oxo-dGTP diphosphatase